MKSVVALAAFAAVGVQANTLGVPLRACINDGSCPLLEDKTALEASLQTMATTVETTYDEVFKSGEDYDSCSYNDECASDEEAIEENVCDADGCGCTPFAQSLYAPCPDGCEFSSADGYKCVVTGNPGQDCPCDSLCDEPDDPNGIFRTPNDPKKKQCASCGSARCVDSANKECGTESESCTQCGGCYDLGSGSSCGSWKNLSPSNDFNNFRMGISRVPKETPQSEKTKGCASVRRSADLIEGDEETLRFGHTICAINQLPALWKEGYVNEGWYWQYYGDQHTGLAQFFPGRAKGEKQCMGTYDPRIRPWYSSAASGPKDVVIVIDTSGSMSNAGRMDQAKGAASAVIKTLNWADRATVIGFGSDVNKMSEKLQKADDSGRRGMNDFVDTLQPAGKTNYEAALGAAFDVLEASKGDEETSTGCNSIVLFLSDGDVTVGASGEELLSSIRAKNDGDRGVKIFTYGLGDDITGSELKSLACENEGIYHEIGDDQSDRLSTIMAKYYGFFASGIARTQEEGKYPIRYSEEYLDASTGVPMITASVPVYDKTGVADGGIPYLFGVIGVDLLTAAYTGENGEDRTAWDAEVVKNYEAAKACVDLTYTHEELEMLREMASRGEEFDARCDGVDGGLIVGVIFFICVVGACITMVMHTVCKRKAAGNGQAPVVVVMQPGAAQPVQQQPAVAVQQQQPPAVVMQQPQQQPPVVQAAPAYTPAAQAPPSY